mmetsp:Transcript_13509/g.31789  ORF Transcript_13509/g.31789 Transcript_13509/m.31789 type:complete len:101 (+) Transcript_13509:110-412(+)
MSRRIRAALLCSALWAVVLTLQGCSCQEEEFRRCVQLRTDLEKISSSSCVAAQALTDCLYDYGCCSSKSEKDRRDAEKDRLFGAGCDPVVHDLCETCVDC